MLSMAVLNDLKNERTKALDYEEKLKALELQNQKLQGDFDSNRGSYEQELITIKTKHDEELQEQKQQLDQLQKEKDEAVGKEKKEREESLEEEKNRLSEENKTYAADIEAKEQELKSLREELEKLNIGYDN